MAYGSVSTGTFYKINVKAMNFKITQKHTSFKGPSGQIRSALEW
jgi:hypothetical protein